MPGLLDFNQDDWLTLAGGLLSGRGDIGQALLAAQTMRSRRGDSQAMRELQQLQLEQQRRQMASQDRIQGAWQGATTPGTPNFSDAGPQIPQAPGVDPQMLQRNLMALGPEGLPALSAMQGMNAKESFTLKPGETRFSGGQQVASLPAEKKEPHAPLQVDRGDRIDFLDRNTLQVVKSVPKGLSPERPQKPQQPPAGYRWAGEKLEPIAGGPADPRTAAGRGQPTEDERRSAGLTVRLESALREMQGLPKDVKPEVVPSAIRPVLGDVVANVATSEGRQKTESAQLDALDAALTLATGAAYTKEQLKNLSRSYFPQLGDTPGTIKAKEARFKEIIQSARIRAGRASDEIDKAAPVDPGIEALLNKYAPKRK